MAIILDTDVVIRGEKGTFDLHGWLTLHATEEIEIAAITVAELWHGVERATQRSQGPVHSGRAPKSLFLARLTRGP